MATYVVGDVQGCMTTLERLLGRIQFSRRDQLWFVGDLVNRGPRSLEVLRFVRALGSRAVAVLGNHDLHLIARAEGLATPKRRDTLDDVLDAPDCDELVEWLRHLPLVHRQGDLMLVHAGLLPRWSAKEAIGRARDVEDALRSRRRVELLTGDGRTSRWLRTFTRLRTCHLDGTGCDFDGHPSHAPTGCLPWFSHPRRRSHGVTVVFGHWSALGLYVGTDAIGLDTGCVWGRSLTAMRVEDRAFFCEPAVEAR
jgi:bis(5'-nucleosyl)-tetraphosphatase (symmetrical)